MRKVFLAATLSISSVFACAQDFNFFESSFDFGKIKELEGPVEHTFLFSNSGNKPLIIKNVKASCGCTTTGYTRDTIMPGDTGFVKASFNPFNRPGNFSKSVTVTANTEQGAHTLSFSGFVIAKQKSLEDEFPIKSGSVRLQGTTTEFGRVSRNDTVIKNFSIYNSSKSEISLKKYDAPAHVYLTFPEVIEPEKKADLQIAFLGKDTDDYGPVSDQLILVTNDPLQPKKNIQLNAEVVDSTIRNFNKEKVKLQKLEIKERFVRFDSISIGKSKEKVIEIKNSGKEDLLIRRIIVNSKYINCKLDKKIIKPGGNANLKVVYSSNDIIGKDAKTITIYSNDPESPVFYIPVTATIVKKPN